MWDEDRERLHAAIRRGIEDVEAGRTVEARQVIERLRARAATR
jgi:predicted transcriptional regulator